MQMENLQVTSQLLDIILSVFLNATIVSGEFLWRWHLTAASAAYK